MAQRSERDEMKIRMTQSWSGWYWRFGLASSLAMAGAIAALADCAFAQIKPDGTLGAESSVVTPTKINGLPTERIDGGAIRGANLFHSFEKFSVSTGSAAYFNNALDIHNIISRVTGSSISNIDGLIRANGTANLFLLNPNGIIFGPNASLNIGGSFLGSTASSLNFADGTQFSATAPQATPLLTVSVPLGLQFGGAAGDIRNQSQATNSSGEVVGLQVQPGKTLALIGGDVMLDGGSLQAPGGFVELGGLAGSGTVRLRLNGNNLRLSFPNSVARANVSLINMALVDVTAGNGGSIAINAQNLDVLGGSRLLAGIRSSLGSVDSQGGDISLNAQGAISVANGSIFNLVQTGSVGNGGSIDITTGSLSVTNGALLAASTFGQGNAGSININARDTVSFDGSSGAFSAVGSGGVGNGGDINITTGSLSVIDGASVSASSEGNGEAGNIVIPTGTLIPHDGIQDSKDKEDDDKPGLPGNTTISPTSLVLTNASSQISTRTDPLIGGQVTTNTPDVDPNLGLVASPAESVDTSELIASSGCGAAGTQGESKFIITGCSRLPPNPNDTLSSDKVWTYLRSRTHQAGNQPSNAVATQPLNPLLNQLVEAQGWAINNEGEVVLTATAPTFTRPIPWRAPLPLWQAAGDRSRKAAALVVTGIVHNSLGSNQQALDYFNQALPLWRAAGDRSGEAFTLLVTGIVYNSLGSNQQALDYFNQALPLWRATGDRSGEAFTLVVTGSVYNLLDSNQQALDYFNQALPLWRAAGDRSGEAITLNNIGSVYNFLGSNQQALDYLNQALLLSRAAGDRSGEADTLTGIGIVYNSLGSKQQALDYFNQALPLWRAVGDFSGEAGTLIGIGNVYSDLGLKQQALDYFNQTLPLSRAVGDRLEEANALNNIGEVYDSLGSKQQALDYFNQALSLWHTMGSPFGEAATLNNIGKVYDSLGSQQQALNYFNQALPILRAVGNRSGEAITLNNIGAAYDSLGSQQQALDYFNQALPILRAVGNRSVEATTLNNIGAIYDSLGSEQQALDYYKQALSLLRAVGNRAVEATTLNNIGLVYDSLGSKQQALDYFNQALPLSRTVGSRFGEAATLFNIARLEGDRGNLTEARTQIEAALEIIESLRTRVASQELRASYFASVQSYYEFYIDLLMHLHLQQPSKGYDALALHTSERARARTLLEILAEANADIRQGVEPKLLEQERRLQQQLDAIEKNRMQLLGGNHTSAQATALEKENLALLAQYREVQAQIRATSPRYAALTQPQPLTLAEIQQQVLDEDTLLLEYSLGPKRSYLWAVTKTGITSYELPKRADIEAAARRFREGLTKPWLSNKAGVSLSQMLLGPVASQLGQKRLLIVSDGALQYLPLGALPIPALTAAASKASPNSLVTPLLIEHEIVSLPSASTLAILRREHNERKPAALKMAILADPVFSRDDERVKKTATSAEKPPSDRSATPRVMPLSLQALERSARESGVNFNRLPFTRQEAEQILKLVPASSRLQAFDFAANRGQVISPNLGQYQIVHFATHGILNSTHPELSGIVLSLVDEQGAPQNGFLRLHEIFNLNLPAELVVLSACQTGLGQEVKGEGLVGLTRGFMYAGSPRVIVSLWSVNDEATALLMTKFYKGILEKGLQPAAALRAAQIEMWKQQRWQAPYYWAAFVLQGEWK